MSSQNYVRHEMYYISDDAYSVLCEYGRDLHLQIGSESAAGFDPDTAFMYVADGRREDRGGETWAIGTTSSLKKAIIQGCETEEECEHMAKHLESIVAELRGPSQEEE